MPDDALVARPPRVIADPLYKYIPVPGLIDGALTDPMIQRMRRVSQNALASLVYPSLTGARFEHALGAMHLACLAWRSAWVNSPGAHEPFRAAFDADPLTDSPEDAEFQEFIEAAVGCVALLH